MAEKTAEQAPERAALKWIGGAVVGLILGGAALYFLARPDEVSAPADTVATTAPVTSETAAPEPQAEAPATEAAEPAAETPEPAAETAETAMEAAPDTATEAVAMPEPVAPSFDTVRVEADGSVLVAGRADAGAAVSILVDDAEAATAEADGKGAFVALFSLDPSDDPRVMTLGVTAPDGTRLQSQETVVIGPIAAPALVAEAAPDPETQPDTAAAEGGSDAGPATAEAPAAADEPSAQVAAAEPAAPEVLIIDNAGVRRQSGAGSVTEIVIDTIGYGATGEVEIAGRGIAGQFARLYLDNADITVVGIGEDGGWGVVLTDVEPGLYTLRVDQTDGTGKVTSRFETPFQREAPDTVIAALQQPQPETKDTATEPAAAATAPSSADAGAESAAAPATAAPEGTAAPEPDTAPNTASGIVPEPVTAGETTAVAAPAPETTPSPATRAAIVTVQPGFTLWRIARENYGDGFLYVKVFEANKDLIRDPDLIYPGQIFSIPDPAE